jgi:hypothetical protein
MDAGVGTPAVKRDKGFDGATPTESACVDVDRAAHAPRYDGRGRSKR